MLTPQLTEYGRTTEVFATRKPRGEAILIGGAGEQDRWTRVLSRRCAHLLWVQLTQVLFPEKVRMVMALAATAPLSDPEERTITSEVTTSVMADGVIEVAGVSGGRRWAARLTSAEARRLWAALDLALYPVGWEGSRVLHHQ